MSKRSEPGHNLQSFHNRVEQVTQSNYCQRSTAVGFNSMYPSARLADCRGCLLFV